MEQEDGEVKVREGKKLLGKKEEALSERVWRRINGLSKVKKEMCEGGES